MINKQSQNRVKEGKIVNDPIYGLIEIPSGLVMTLIEHPYFQRLRRIMQLGLTHYVYPGATHNRFHHSLGAMYLVRKAVETLRKKNIEISDEEAEGVTIAILLHDVGHGPFSHSLEHCLIDVVHEELSKKIMYRLNEIFEGQLTMALAIFEGTYHKRFLHQLVSGQLDMDRMDYLTRDSFFTGVQEGKVGYSRLLKLLHVHKDQLVIEFKGIYSVENFLIARRLMYWQVYLHKNVICAGEMLVQIMNRARDLLQKGIALELSNPLRYFLSQALGQKALDEQTAEVLDYFYQLDDTDIMAAVKGFVYHQDSVLSFLSKSLLERQLLHIDLRDKPIERAFIKQTKQMLVEAFPTWNKEELDSLLFEGREANNAYKKGKEEILILLKNNSVRPISEWQEHCIQSKEIVKYFACYPKQIKQ
ncbi:MAG: HD domain-containing protein [Aureispira sp.]